MVGFFGGRYAARFASGREDMRAVQGLRSRLFRDDPGADAASDADAFDAICEHVLVEDTRTGRLVCCYRFLSLRDGSQISKSYSAQFYNLDRLERYAGRIVEMGRFCIDPEVKDPAVLRVAWGAMTRYVDANDVALLFGCSSFQGTEAEAYEDAFALLKEHHIAPKRWLPRPKAPSIFQFAARLRRTKPDLREAMRRMPPLLRTYLAMGGWVSDHAVVDRDLNTLHVFTGLEISRIPETRKRLLRAAVG